jgi:hypothetical protein
MRNIQGGVLPGRGGGLRRSGLLYLTLPVALSFLLVLSHPLWAATIVVDETTCTLVDAITAANTAHRKDKAGFRSKGKVLGVRRSGNGFSVN